MLSVCNDMYTKLQRRCRSVNMASIHDDMIYEGFKPDGKEFEDEEMDEDELG